MAKRRRKFSKALQNGLKNLKSQISKVKSQGMKSLSGEIVFDLYQSYGFPVELTKEIAQKKGYKLMKLVLKKNSKTSGNFPVWR